jgi:thymidylate synthase ThyX
VPEWAIEWERIVSFIKDGYAHLIDAGAPAQDARGILPIHVTTSIMAKFNLRSLHEMAKLRLCTRTQGEYQDVFRAMRAAVLSVHPWAEEFIEVQCVSTGTCAFPRYGKAECPVYLPEMDRTETMIKAKALFWSLRHEATPIAREGKAM